MRAHPSAIIEPGAKIGDGAVIGPFCHVGSQVEIGADAELVSHVVALGATKIGARAKIYPFATIGTRSQDLKSAEGEGRLIIGADCVIREGVTVNAGTQAGGGETIIGAHCALLAQSHVAHDCKLGEGVVLSNAVLLGGHIEIGAHAMIGGATAVHQFVRVGTQAFVAGLSGVERDVMPFALAGGDRAHLFGLNIVGLERRGFARERIEKLREAYRLLFAPGQDGALPPLAERVEKLAAFALGHPDVEELVTFLRAPSNRPLCAPRAGGRA